MRAFKTTIILLLAVLVISTRSLPLNIQNSAENSEISASESVESESVKEKSNELSTSTEEETSSDEDDAELSETIESKVELALQNYLKEQRYLNQLNAAINELSNEENESSFSNENVDELDNRVVKRSPEIPDPERYREPESDDRPERPSVHPTHDEYLEWKSKQPRYRRNSDDDSLEEDYHNVEAFVENSLEDYAQGCEVMTENSDENNETTYDDYRRKREVNDEEIAEESKEELQPSEAQEELESEQSESESDSESESEPDTVVQSDDALDSEVSAVSVEDAEESNSQEEVQEVNPVNDDRDESIVNSNESHNESDSLSSESLE